MRDAKGARNVALVRTKRRLGLKDRYRKIAGARLAPPLQKLGVRR